MINLHLTSDQKNKFDYLVVNMEKAVRATKSAYHNGRRDSHETWMEDSRNLKNSLDNLENFLKPFGVELKDYQLVETNPIPGIDFPI